MTPHDPIPAPTRRRWPRVVLAVAAILIVVVLVANRINLNYYVLAPGDAQPVAPLITVPPDRAHPVHGQILLTDVLLSQVTLLDYVPYLLSSDDQVIPSSELLGPDTPPDQLVAQGYLEMAQAQSAAKAAALRRLDYTVTEHDGGVVVYAVAPTGPSAAALQVAQTIQSVDGAPTPNECAFVGAMAPLRPGQVVQLGVEQSTVNANAVIVPGKTVDKSVTLATRPKGTGGATGCPGVPRLSSGYLGVEVQTQQNFTYPFPVVVHTQDIGGPSAGLAMTLGIIDKLTVGQLTGGLTVAATGTMDDLGNVGDVGGVAQKTVAVENAGATVFLVPPQEYRVALSKATPSLHVYGVSTLDQALADLAKLGGHVPPAASATTTAPATTVPGSSSG